MGGKLKCPICEAALIESTQADTDTERWQCPNANCGTIVMRDLSQTLAVDSDTPLKNEGRDDHAM